MTVPGPIGEWTVTGHDTDPDTEAISERIVWTHQTTGVSCMLEVLRTVCSVRVRAGGVDVTLSLGYPRDRTAALQTARQWMAGHPRGDPPALRSEGVAG